MFTHQDDNKPRPAGSGAPTTGEPKCQTAGVNLAPRKMPRHVRMKRVVWNTLPLRTAVAMQELEMLNLPLSGVSKIIKSVLPVGVAISQDAKVAISRATAVFVLYASTMALETAGLQKRKIIKGSDVAQVLVRMGHEDFLSDWEGETKGPWSRRGASNPAEKDKAPEDPSVKQGDEPIAGQELSDEEDNENAAFGARVS